MIVLSTAQALCLFLPPSIRSTDSPRVTPGGRYGGERSEDSLNGLLILTRMVYQYLLNDRHYVASPASDCAQLLPGRWDGW
jgi:hypothetical protein